MRIYRELAQKDPENYAAYIGMTLKGSDGKSKTGVRGEVADIL
jgi:hypothetical protein